MSENRNIKEEALRQLKEELREELIERVSRPLKEDKKTLLDYLKNRLWEQYYANEETAFKAEALRRLFSDEGGVIYYCQHFIGLAKNMAIDGNLEKSKEMILNKFVYNLQNCIQVVFPLNEQGIVLAYNFKCATNRDAYIKNMEILNGNNGKKWVDFAESKDKEGQQMHCNLFYHSLFMACFGLLNYYIADFEQDINNCTTIGELQTLLGGQVLLLKHTFSCQGIAFVDYTDSLPEEVKEDCFLSSGQSMALPAVIRKEDNYLYFKGYVNQ